MHPNKKVKQMANQTNLEEPKINVADIKKNARVFVAKSYEMENYPLIKKEDIEGTTFLVFEYKTVKDELGKVYYNFKCLNKKDAPFCFNGSNVLAEQIEDFGMPAYVKLTKKIRVPENKLRPYYWIFEAGEV